MSSDFILIRPIDITAAMITDCNVPETVAATYNAGSTYAAGDLAGPAPVDGDPQSVYISLQSGNIGHAQNETSWWRLLGVVYPAYSAGVSYNIGDIVTDTTNHLLYSSIANGHTGSALTDVTKWELVGPTNKFKAIDEVYNTQTTNNGTIVYEITPGELITAVALLNVEGASATIEQTVSGYSSTVNLAEHNVLTWYDFFYEIPSRKQDVVFTDIPPYPAAVLTITIDNGTSDAACGVLVIGRYRTLGETQWEGTRSINDYSVIAEDAGSVTLTQRSYSKRLNVDVRVPEGFESEAVKILEQYRATPLVFVAASEIDMSIIYGFLGAWNVPFTNSGRRANIEIKGLI